MERVTGVVMEQEGTHVIVLTSLGEFKRIKCRGKLPEIGEEISIRTNPRKSFIPRIAWVAAAAAVLLIALVSPLNTVVNQPPEMATAWVTVDINPSLELTVSNRGRVIEITPINPDGQKLTDRVKVIGLNAQEAVAVLTRTAADMGYISTGRDNNVLISVVSDVRNFDGAQLESKLIAATQQVLLEERMVASVQTVKATAEFREQARKKDISTAKYAVLVEAVTSGVLINEEEIKETSITEAIQKAGGEPDKILKKAHDEKIEQLPEKERKYMMIAGSSGSTPEDIGIKPGGQDDKMQLIDKPIRSGGPEQVKPAGTEPADEPADPIGGQPPVNEPGELPLEEPGSDDSGGLIDPYIGIGDVREKDNTMN